MVMQGACPNCRANQARAAEAEARMKALETELDEVKREIVRLHQGQEEFEKRLSKQYEDKWQLWLRMTSGEVKNG